MSLTEKQQAAHKLASDYLGFLSQQEAMMNRLFERKWQEMQPKIEQMIDKKIREHLAS